MRDEEVKNLKFDFSWITLVLRPTFGQHFTKNQFFFYDKILAIIRSIPPTFPVLIPLPELIIRKLSSKV